MQNSYAPNAERGPSVTDQRQRFVAAIFRRTSSFHREHELLGHVFNDWKISSIVTAGSGRPVNATVSGDPNQDGNDSMTAFPATAAMASPDPIMPPPIFASFAKSTSAHATAWNFTADSFNLFNRDNQRVTITSDGLTAEATTFTPYTTFVNGTPYPAYYQQPQNSH